MLHTVMTHLFSVPVPILEKIVRPIIVYIFLVLLLRVFGKRELAQLNPFDLVVLLSLSNTVQNAIIGEDNSVAVGMIGAFTLLLINYVVVRFLFRHRRLDQILEGKPTVLVKDGRLCKSAMAKELITVSELQTVARRQGFDGVKDIQSCILEPGGAFAMTRKQPSPEDAKHSELIARLDTLGERLARLEGSMGDSRAGS